MSQLAYLTGYPAETIQQVQDIIDRNKLSDYLRKKYPTSHEIRTDKQLYLYTQSIKAEFMSKASPLNKASYDNKIQVMQHALGQHHFINRVHGSKIRAVNEIKIASLFKNTPEDFLRMIVVHELAHFKEKEHNKSFYQLCRHMEPNYHQLEFDTRLYLTHLDLFGELYST